MIELLKNTKSFNADTLTQRDIIELIKLLNEKDNDIRYKAFQLLEARSEKYSDILRYFDIFALKLINNNSYQKSIGLRLIAVNAKWDDCKIDNVIKSYLSLCEDENAVVVRDCIQGLCKILPYKNNLWSQIVKKLVDIDLGKIKETMRSLVTKDIIKVLKYINDAESNSQIEEYFDKLLKNNIFDEQTLNDLEKEITK